MCWGHAPPLARGPEWGPAGGPAPGAPGPAELQGGRPTAAVHPGLGAQVAGRGGPRPSTSPADFPSLQCGQDGKQLHPGPCDLHSVSQRFEDGHYKSVVSGTRRGTGGCQEERIGVKARVLTNPLTAQLHGGCGGHPDEALGRRRDAGAPGWRPDEGAPTEGELFGGCLEGS